MNNDNGMKSGRLLGLLIGLVVAIAAVIAAIVPLLVSNLEREDKWHYKRIEQYENLLSSIGDVSCEQRQTNQVQSQDELAQQLKICWLYCSDAVINQGYVFLEQVENREDFTAMEQKQTLLNLVQILRMEIYQGRSHLTDEYEGYFTRVCE